MGSLLLSIVILGFGLAYYTHAIPVAALRAHGDQKDRLIFIIAISTMLCLAVARIVTTIAA